MRKKLVTLLLCMTMVLSCACGTKTDNNDVSNDNGNQTEEKQTEEKQTENLEEESVANSILNETLFEEKIEELVSTYGMFQEEQSATMYTPNDEWFNPNGIVSTTIFDFDSDGETELLVCQTKLVLESDGEYQVDEYKIEMNMYEVEEGTVVLADSKLFGTYIEEEGLSGWTLRKAQWMELAWNLHILELDNRNYLMCEDYGVAASFADGSGQDYWMLEYTNNHFQYVCAFTQTAGGSADFEHTGYEFSDGQLKSTTMYYNEYEPESALYDDFFVAMTEFFKKYNISLDVENRYSEEEGITSILSENNKKTKIFEFKNRMVEGSYWPDIEYKYIATLETAK